MIDAILDKGALNLNNQLQRNILKIISEKDLLEVLIKLEAYSKDKPDYELNLNENHGELIKAVVKNESLKLLKYLLTKDNLEVTFQNNLPLRLACCKGKLEVVILLLSDMRVRRYLSDKSNGSFERALKVSQKHSYTKIVSILNNL